MLGKKVKVYLQHDQVRTVVVWLSQRLSNLVARHVLYQRNDGFRYSNVMVGEVEEDVNPNLLRDPILHVQTRVDDLVQRR